MRRKLYSDLDVSILSARRIVILNGIDATVQRADFARRIADFELDGSRRSRATATSSRNGTRSTHLRSAPCWISPFHAQGLPETALAGDEQSLTMSIFAGIAKTIEEPALKLYISRLGTSAADIVDADPFAGQLIGSSAPARCQVDRARR